MSFPTGFSFIALESFEQGVQTLEVGLPNTPVLLQPHLKLLERLGPQGVDAALRIHANVNQSGITENAQVLGDLRLAETQPVNHVPDRARPVEQEFDDLKSVGLGKSAKCFQHHQPEYAPQRIFLSRHISVKEYTSGSRTGSENFRVKEKS
jgi:hypothetical protein